MRLAQSLRDAISYFTSSLIAGEYGPDDSRYSRDQLFLKEPSVVAQATSVFLYCFEFDHQTNAMNYDEAEERVRQYIRWKFWGESPETPFNEEELGIRKV